MRLTWTLSAAGNFALYSVVMVGSPDEVVVTITDRNTLDYTVSGLEPETAYTFRVDVVSTEDVTGKGNSVSVVTDDDRFIPASTPDLVMENFVNSWEAMNTAEYAKLLHTEFQFFLDPADNLWPFVGGPSWDRESEMGSVTAMFTNQPGVDPETEEPIDPILSIQFQVFDALDAGWQVPPDEPIYERTVRQRFQVSILVTYQGGANSTRVSGVNYFYVQNIGDNQNPLWVIKVWEDQASTDAGNKTEETSWGTLKAAY